MDDDVETLKARAEQYRRLLTGMPDQRTARVISNLIAEVDEQIAQAEKRVTATQSQQEQPPKKS